MRKNQDKKNEPITQLYKKIPKLGKEEIKS
jgi:hypothetical protein